MSTDPNGKSFRIGNLLKVRGRFEALAPTAVNPVISQNGERSGVPPRSERGSKGVRRGTPLLNDDTSGTRPLSECGSKGVRRSTPLLNLDRSGVHTRGASGGSRGFDAARPS